MSEKVEMTPGIRALWEEDLLLDYTIEVEDEEFKVHKVVMAGLCDYFKAMFRAGMKESEADRIRLEGFSALAVHNLIQFIYTSQFGHRVAPAEELLKLAVYLQFPRGIEVCEEYLCDQIFPTNCLRLLSVFTMFSLKRGIKFSADYMKEHFNSVMEDCEPDTLELDVLVLLMDCWNRSEWELFELAKQWLEPEDRKQHVNEVMSHVRFPLLSPAEIISITNMSLYSKYARSWCELIDQARVYHSLPTHRKVLDHSEETKVRSEPTPVSFPGKDSSANNLYSQEDKWCCQKVEEGEPEDLNLNRTWQCYKTLNIPHFTKKPRSFVVANNFLIVSEMLGDTYVTNNSPLPVTKWYIFDPRAIKWSTMASLGKDRTNCAVVYHEKHLYALGGIEVRAGSIVVDVVSDVIEKYDFESDTWTVIPSKLPRPLHGHTALSTGGAIYVTGGSRVGRMHHDFSTRMDSFDPGTGTWVRKPPVKRTSRNMKIQLLELEGQEVISVLDETMRVQYYTPTSNEWTMWAGGERTARGHMPVMWDDAGYVVPKGCYLYLLNFSAVNGDEHKCARYELRISGGAEILEIGLDDFPMAKKSFFCALLSINHQMKSAEPPPASEDHDSD